MGTQDSLSSDVLQTGEEDGTLPLEKACDCGLGKYLCWGPCCCWPVLHWADLLRQQSNSRKQVLGPTAWLLYLSQAGQSKDTIKVHLGEPMSVKLMGSLTANMDEGSGGTWSPPNMSDSLWTLDSRSTHGLQGSNRLERDLVRSFNYKPHITPHTHYQTTPQSPPHKG